MRSRAVSLLSPPRPPRIGGRGGLALPMALATVLLAAALSSGIDRLRAPLTSRGPVTLAADRRPLGERTVEEAQKRLVAAPTDPKAMVRLASAYLLRARETADPSYYPRAERLLEAAIATRPEDVDAFVALGTLALARHEFEVALTWARRSVEQAPNRPQAYGVMTDALVELGRYDEAVDAAQRMVDLRPAQPALARVSYLRELHGDLAGAIHAMGRAVQAGAPDTEATAWSQVQLGNLLFAAGDLDGAARAYDIATRRVDGYPYGVAGLARVEAARGQLAQAAELYGQLVARMPLPEFAAALGDVYLRMGEVDRAQQQYELVRASQQLLAANGVRVDADLAMFNADHDIELEQALEALIGEYTTRPSVHIAMALAWVEHRLGHLDAAFLHSLEALRLDTKDPLMLYRAGVIAQANGDMPRAYRLLETSSDLNPNYSILWSQDLAERWATLRRDGGSR